MEAPMRVVLRVRPLSAAERGQKEREAVGCPPGQPVARLLTSVEAGRRVEAQEFAFDHVFPPAAAQEEVFQQCGVEELLNTVLDGHCATLFAYGQTGSGKTHTMTGDCSDPALAGLCPRAVHALYERRERRAWDRPDLRYTLRASYLEVYNEQVNDMLDPQSVNLNLRWSAQQQAFFVEHLTLIECDTEGDMLACLEEGLRNRHTASHELNRDSSRSHTMFSICCDVEPRVGSASAFLAARYGKLHLVDLAGSERLKDSRSANDAAAETAHINRSLLALGQVIAVLASDARKHIPYRDSKLTKLLMDSLGGTARTVLIATVAPGQRFADETANTLKFATRAKNVRSRPAVRLDAHQQLVMALQMEVEALTAENAILWQHLPALADSRQLAALRERQRLRKLQSQGEGGEGPGVAEAEVELSRVTAALEAVREEADRLAAENEALRRRVASLAPLLEENERLKRNPPANPLAPAAPPPAPHPTAVPAGRPAPAAAAPTGVLRLAPAARPIRIDLTGPSPAPPLRCLLEGRAAATSPGSTASSARSTADAVSTLDLAESLPRQPSPELAGPRQFLLAADDTASVAGSEPESLASAQQPGREVAELREERTKLLWALKYTDGACDALRREGAQLGQQLADAQRHAAELQATMARLEAEKGRLGEALAGDARAGAVHRRLRYLEERNTYLSRLLTENGLTLEL